jgi:hypothetical protein
MEILMSDDFTKIWRKRVVFKIYFYTYCDNHYSSFCTRVGTFPEIKFVKIMQK